MPRIEVRNPTRLRWRERVCQIASRSCLLFAGSLRIGTFINRVPESVAEISLNIVTQRMTQNELSGVITGRPVCSPGIQGRKLTLEEPVRRCRRRTSVDAVEIKIGKSGCLTQNLAIRRELLVVDILSCRKPPRRELREHIFDVSYS